MFKYSPRLGYASFQVPQELDTSRKIWPVADALRDDFDTREVKCQLHLIVMYLSVPPDFLRHA